MTGSLHLYRSYNFTDKDPIIDKIRTVVDDAGESYKKIHEASGVSSTTLYNWFEGKTRRPQFATIEAVARSLGKTLVFADLKEAKVIPLKTARRAHR